MHHEKYHAGEEGFAEIRYNGWVTPYTVVGDYHYYIFDSNSRVRYVDKRDVNVLLEIVEDGVKIFDKIEG